MKCGCREMKLRLYLMVRCVGQMYGPFHHNRCNFTCSLCLLCAQYDDVLEIPTQNMLSYHMRWSQSLGSCCLFWSCLALGLRLEIWICYILIWTKQILMLDPQKMMRRPPCLPMLYSCLATLLPVSYIPFLSGECELSRQCLKAWGMSWGIWSDSETCRIIYPWLENNLKLPN